MEAFGPWVLTLPLTPPGSVQERFRARRVIGADVGGPVQLTRREGTAEEHAALLQRWCRSAEERARLQHPALIQTLEVGEAEGYVFEVRESPDGLDLFSLLKQFHDAERHPPLDVSLTVCHELLRTLAAAHADGWFAGYLTLDRVVLTYDGRVLLAEVGLPESELRAPGFVAPEVSRGREPGPSVDVWVAGRLFKQMLLGLRGERPRVPAKHAGATKEILKGMLSPSRARRFTVDDALAELEALLDRLGDDPPTLAQLMAERFAEDPPLPEARLDTQAVARAGEGSAVVFFPPERAVPLPLLPADALRDETITDTVAGAVAPNLDDEEPPEGETVAGAPSFLREVRRGSSSGSGSDEAGPLDVDVFADAGAPIRTEVGRAPPISAFTRTEHRALIVTDSKGGGGPSIPWASAEQLVSAEGDLELHADAHIPAHIEGTLEIPSVPDAVPPPMIDEIAATRVLEVVPEVEPTRPEEGAVVPVAPGAVGDPTGRGPRLISPDERTRTGTGHDLPFEDPPSVDNVWAESGRQAAAPGGPRVGPPTTEVLDLPPARVSVVDEAVLPGFAAVPDTGSAPGAEDRTMMLDPDPGSLPSRSSPGLEVFQSVPDHEGEVLGDAGALVVDAPDKAVTFLDGERQGRGRVRIDGLDRFRTYGLKVHLVGHRPWTAQVCLDGQRLARVTPDLEPRKPRPG